MRYILTGHDDEGGFRRYGFEGVADDNTRTAFRVKTDLSVTRRFGILLQELPLLCRTLLEGRAEGDQQRTFTFGEEDMTLYATRRALKLDAKRRTPPRPRPATSTVGHEPAEIGMTV